MPVKISNARTAEINMVSQSEVDTEVGQDVMDECCKLQLKDHPIEEPSQMKKISRGLSKLLNHRTRHVMQSILDYSWLIISTLAIFSLGALWTYQENSLWHSESTSTRYALLVSLCDFSPNFIPQRDVSEHAGFTLIGKFFYTMMNRDHVNSDEVCGVKITLISNPNATRCKMIFTPNTTYMPIRRTNGMGEMYSIDGRYDFVVLPEVNQKSYNRSAPLHERWGNVTLTSPYKKFSTEWLKGMQLGDAKYDSVLLMLQNIAETLVIDLNHGLIMSTKQQEHAPKAVKVLSFVGKSLIVEESVRNVLSQAMLNFCGQVQTTSNIASVTLELSCPGVTRLPTGLQCFTDESDAFCMCANTQNVTSVSAESKGRNQRIETLYSQQWYRAMLEL